MKSDDSNGVYLGHEVMRTKLHHYFYHLGWFEDTMEFAWKWREIEAISPLDIPEASYLRRDINVGKLNIKLLIISSSYYRVCLLLYFNLSIVFMFLVAGYGVQFFC